MTLSQLFWNVLLASNSLYFWHVVILITKSWFKFLCSVLDMFTVFHCESNMGLWDLLITAFCFNLKFTQHQTVLELELQKDFWNYIKRWWLMLFELVNHNPYFFIFITKVSDSCPITSPKDHLLLSVGAEVYKVCPDPDALLPHLIKDNPLLPVVYNHKIKIDVNTGG